MPSNPKKTGRPKKDSIPKGFQPKTAADFDRILASEGMPKELEDLPSSWTVYDPIHDGMTIGDPLRRAPGQEAARVELDAESTRIYYRGCTNVLAAECLTHDETKIWELYCEGKGWPTIKKATGFTKWKITSTVNKILSRTAKTGHET